MAFDRREPGRKRYGNQGFWPTFCVGCCYHDKGVCQKSGLNTRFERFFKFGSKALDKCPLWPRAEEKIVETRRPARFSFEGSLKDIYSKQKSFARKRDPVRYAVHYTYDEFRRRMARLGYRRAWLRWVRSGFDAGLRPTVRRRRRTIGYTLQNIFLSVKVDNGS